MQMALIRTTSFDFDGPPSLSCSTWDQEHAKQGQQIRNEATQTDHDKDFSRRIRTCRHVKYFDYSVLNYDTELVTGPCVFRAAINRAAFLGRYRLWRDVLLTQFFGLLVLVSLLCLETDVADYQAVTKKLQDLSVNFHNLCVFLMGFFVNICFSRWWSIRTDAIGGLWGAINDLTLVISSHFGQDTQPHQEVRELVMRWSFLSHELIYKQVNADCDLSDLVAGGLLTLDEKKLLEMLPSKPQVVWAWMCSYFAHLAYGDPSKGGSRLPFPVTILPQLHEICRHARGSIGLTFAYTDTQVPFRYVHFLSFIIWLHNLIQAYTSAVIIADLLKGSAEGPRSQSIVIEIFFVTFYPLVFFGLLHLGAGMLNPVRSRHDVDFPQGAFSYYMLSENRAFVTGNVSPHGPPYGAPPDWSKYCRSGSDSHPLDSQYLGSKYSATGNVKGRTHSFAQDSALVPQLECLCQLKADGFISGADFEKAKEKIIGR